MTLSYQTYFINFIFWCKRVWLDLLIDYKSYMMGKAALVGHYYSTIVAHKNIKIFANIDFYGI